MKLLLSQKNQLFDIIESNDLSPSQFEFIEPSPDYKIFEAGTKLKFKNAAFFYSFESSIGDSSKHTCTFSPGENTIQESQLPNSWENQIFYFGEWITYLKREITAPNKWERFQSELKSFDINFEADEDKFTVQEYEDVIIKMSLLKERITTIGILPEHLDIINQKLDNLTDNVKVLGKSDWKSFFMGTMMSIIIQLSISQEQGAELWLIIKQVFSNLLLP